MSFFLPRIIILATCGTRALTAQAPTFALAGAAYDIDRGRAVVVGTPRGASAMETWEWNGSSWSRIEGEGPSAREEPLLVYDAARHRVLLHGGRNGSDVFNDTWTFDGTRWKKLAVDAPLRDGAVATYDSRRNRILMFGGGRAPQGPFHNDLWAFDGDRWTRIVADSLPGSPSPRVLHGLAYDPEHDRLVVVGGAIFENGQPHPLDDAWEWDGAAWRKIAFPGSLARDHIGMVYAPDRKAIVLHGGGNPTVGLMGDTWTYDGASWTKLTDEGPQRGRHRVFYDARANALMLFGGWGPRQQLPELWTLKGKTWVKSTP